MFIVSKSLSVKKIGDQFEGVFEFRCRSQGVLFLRVPNGCRQVGPKPNQLIRVRSPFDCVIDFQGKIALLDLKTYSKNRISHGDLVPHQIQNLLDFETCGHIAGYIVFFREADKIVFYSASLLNMLRPGQGFSIDAGLLLGSREDIDVRKLFLTRGEVSELQAKEI